VRRILHYTAAAVPGGLLLGHLLPLASGTAAHGYQSEVWIRPEVVLDGVAADLVRRGVEVRRLTVEGKGDLRGMIALARALRRARPDILHVHLASPVESMPVLLLAPRIGRARIVATEHLPTHHPRRRAWSRMVKAWASRRVARVVTVSPADTDYLVREFGLPREKMRYVPNGVPLHASLPAREEARRALGVSPAATVIGYVGEITERKGLADLVEALAIVARPDGASPAGAHAGLDRSPVVLLAGEGPFAAAIREHAARTHLDDRLRLLGPLRPPHAVYAACDIFVLPSHSEAMPLALLEAMAAGRPVVATAVSGVPEVVRDGVEGYLVPPRDPESLADALARMLADPPGRERMGIAAKRRVEEAFSVERMVAVTCALYGEVLAGGPP